MQIIVDDPQLPKHAINLRTADTRYSKKINFKFQQAENLIKNRFLITMPQIRRVINVFIKYTVRNVNGLESNSGEINIILYRNDSNTSIKSVHGIGSLNMFGYPIVEGNDVKLCIVTSGTGITLNDFDVDFEIKNNNDNWIGEVSLIDENGILPNVFCENINTNNTNYRNYVTIGDDSGGSVLRLTTSIISNHTYMEFYARGGITRSGWLGYGGNGVTDLSLVNELSGHLVLNVVDGKLKTNSIASVANDILTLGVANSYYANNYTTLVGPHDFNNLIPSSNSLIGTIDGTISNSPSGVTNLRFLSIGYGGRVSQIAMPYDADNIFFRRKQDDIWSSWKTVWHDGNFNPSLKADVSSLSNYWEKSYNVDQPNMQNVYNNLTNNGLSIASGVDSGFQYYGLVAQFSSTDGLRRLQFGTNYESADNPTSLYVRSYRDNGVFRNWVEVWTTANFNPTTKADVSALAGYVSLSGSYSDPSWITSLDWSKISGAPSIPTNYVTINTDQHGLSGNKTTSGVWSFSESSGGVKTRKVLGYGSGTGWLDFNEFYTMLRAENSQGSLIWNFNLDWELSGKNSMSAGGFGRIKGSDTKITVGHPLLVEIDSALKVTSIPSGIQAGLLAYDSSGNIIQGSIKTINGSSILGSENIDLLTLGVANSYYANNYTTLVGPHDFNNLIPSHNSLIGTLDGTILNSPSGVTNLRFLSIGYGGRVSQIAMPYDADNIFFRRKQDGTWSSWKTVWHDGNFDPSLKANASSLSNYVTLSQLDAHDYLKVKTLSDINTPPTYQQFYVATYISTANNKPFEGDDANAVLNIYSYPSVGGGTYGKQIAFGNTDDIYIRRVTNGSFFSWRKIWHDGNFDPNLKANASSLSNYVTVDTNQTITGEKLFNAPIELSVVGGNSYIKNQVSGVADWTYGTATTGSFFISNSANLTVDYAIGITNGTREVQIYNNLTGSTASFTGLVSGIAATSSSNFVIKSQLDTKQDTLVSGTNIKTVGGNSLVGSGDVPWPSLSGYATESWVTSGYIQRTSSSNQTITRTGSSEFSFVSNGSFVSKDLVSGSLNVINSSGGEFYWENSSGVQGIIRLANITASRNWVMPDVSGTVALTNQIPTNFITSDTPQVGLTGDKTSSGNWSIGNVTATSFYTDGSIYLRTTGVIRVRVYQEAGEFRIRRHDLSGNYVGTPFYIDSTGKNYLNGDTRVMFSTVSTSSTTGALVVSGGVGIGGVLNVANNVNITGQTSGINIIANTNLGGVYTISSLMPNLINNSSNVINFGKSIANYNSCLIRYNHVSDGNTYNNIGLGLIGSEDTLKIIGDGSAIFSGNVIIGTGSVHSEMLQVNGTSWFGDVVQVKISTDVLGDPRAVNIYPVDATSGRILLGTWDGINPGIRLKQGNPSALGSECVNILVREYGAEIILKHDIDTEFVKINKNIFNYSGTEFVLGSYQTRSELLQVNGTSWFGNDVHHSNDVAIRWLSGAIIRGTSGGVNFDCLGSSSTGYLVVNAYNIDWNTQTYHRLSWDGNFIPPTGTHAYVLGIDTTGNIIQANGYATESWVTSGYVPTIRTLKIGASNAKPLSSDLDYSLQETKIAHGGNYQSIGDIDASDLQTGLYTFEGGSTGTKPSGVDAANLRLININDGTSGRITQIAQAYSADELFFRRRENATWYSWKKMWHDGNFNPNSKANVSDLNNYLLKNFSNEQILNYTSTGSEGQFIFTANGHFIVKDITSDNIITMNPAGGQFYWEHLGTGIQGVLTLSTITDNRTWVLPDASGIVALTSMFNNYVPTTRTLTIYGTPNQVNVSSPISNDLSSNRDWTLSLPQDIHTGASPTFANLTIAGDSSSARYIKTTVNGESDWTFGTATNGSFFISNNANLTNHAIGIVNSTKEVQIYNNLTGVTASFTGLVSGVVATNANNFIIKSQLDSHDYLKVKTLSDINTLPTYQQFYVATYISTANNKPFEGDDANAVLNIYSHPGGSGGTYGKQIAFGNTDDIYIRRVSEGNFLSWRKIWHDGNFDPNLKANASSLSNYVTLNTQETIYGIKTFSNPVEIYTTAPTSAYFKTTVVSVADWSFGTHSSGIFYISKTGDLSNNYAIKIDNSTLNIDIFNDISGKVANLTNLNVVNASVSSYIKTTVIGLADWTFGTDITTGSLFISNSSNLSSNHAIGIVNSTKEVQIYNKLVGNNAEFTGNVSIKTIANNYFIISDNADNNKNVFMQYDKSTSTGIIGYNNITRISLTDTTITIGNSNRMNLEVFGNVSGENGVFTSRPSANNQISLALGSLITHNSDEWSGIRFNGNGTRHGHILYMPSQISNGSVSEYRFTQAGTVPDINNYSYVSGKSGISDNHFVTLSQLNAHDYLKVKTLSDLYTSPTYQQFYVATYTSSANNKPFEGDDANAVLNIYSHPGDGGGTYGKQIAFGNTDDMYMRRVSNGTFWSWRKVIHDASLISDFYGTFNNTSVSTTDINSNDTIISAFNKIQGRFNDIYTDSSYVNILPSNVLQDSYVNLDTLEDIGDYSNLIDQLISNFDTTLSMNYDYLNGSTRIINNAIRFTKIHNIIFLHGMVEIRNTLSYTESGPRLIRITSTSINLPNSNRLQIIPIHAYCQSSDVLDEYLIINGSHLYIFIPKPSLQFTQTNDSSDHGIKLILNGISYTLN